MEWVNYFCILSSVVAIVHGGRIPDEKLLDEEAFGEYRETYPYGFDLRSVGSPTYEVSGYETSPPWIALKSAEDSRAIFRQRNPNGRSNGRSNGRNNNNNRDPTDTNELSNGDQNWLDLLFRADNNDKRKAFLREQQTLEDARNFYNVGEIRKKREANPEPTGRGYRSKRTHCKHCGGGGHGGYGGYPAVPVYAVAVPVYSGGHGGHGGHGGYVHKPSYGGGGCNTCGSPGHGGGFGGGGGFSGSYSHSQSSSSSGSWGFGKK